MSKNSHKSDSYDNGRAVVDEQSLVWPNSYSNDKPGFLIRGYYRDEEFCCRDCGMVEVWTAKRQKWWYEIAKGGIFTTATRCRACRAAERLRIAQARRTHLDGVAAKKRNGEQNGTEQPATRSQSKSEGSYKPQPESEGRSR